jgi:ABC-2 type transport system permease protein
MNFWRGAWLVAAKEFRHLRHDPYTLVLTVLMPLSQFLLFGYALETRVHDISTVIQNQDGERFSRALADQFAHSPVFRVTAQAGSEEQLLASLRRGEARVAVQIPPGYSKAVFYGRPVTVRVWIDGSEAAVAGQAVTAVEAIGLQQAIAATVAGLPARTLPLQFKTDLLYNSHGKSANYFIPGLVTILLEVTTLLLVALSFVKELERGTLDQLRITSIGVASLVAGKLFTCAAMGVGTGIVLTTLMSLVFGIHLQGSLWLYAAALLMFLLPALGIGLFLTAEARNQAQALQLTYLVFIPSVLLSGFIFPRHTMPAPVAAISSLLPATWSVEIVRGIVLRGAGWQDLRSSFLVVALLGVVYLLAGAIHLVRRLR